MLRETRHHSTLTSTSMETRSTQSRQPVSRTPDIVRVNTPEELLSVDLDRAVNAPVKVLEALGLDTVDEEDEMHHAT